MCRVRSSRANRSLSSFPLLARFRGWPRRWFQRMRQYLDRLRHVLERGTRKANRTGTDALSVFGYQMRFDLSVGFPMVTTKKLHMRSIIHELLWFLSGETNVEYLRRNGVTIW